MLHFGTIYSSIKEFIWKYETSNTIFMRVYTTQIYKVSTIEFAKGKFEQERLH